MDLAEICLDSGKVLLYKWGAAPSWLVSRHGIEKIGTAGPPPGLSVTDYRETTDRLFLRRGETLVLVSDGVPEEALNSMKPDQSPGEMATALLSGEKQTGEDDATVVTIRLLPGSAST
jgi:serine phosphatase RsbU (regulator of sigma subunit)